MGMEDLVYQDLWEVADLIRRRVISPVELTEAILDRIDRLNGRLWAFITVTADEARRAAKQAEAEIAAGAYRGPLHGIPVSLKDLIATRGIRTTAASRVLAGWVPEEDAAVWERLKAAGAVLVGKINLHEFAQGASLVSDAFGAARNPWDTDRTTNGSSSGSGAAVAAGLSFASIGTETGASIRRPASSCGIVGFKPTYGRVSRQGVIPASWSLDHVGPLTRSTRDAALVLAAIAGHDRHDPGSCREPAPDFAAGLGRGVAGLRIGVPWSHIAGTVDPEVEQAFRTVMAWFEGAGASLVDLDLPRSEYTAVASNLVMWAEAGAFHARWLDRCPERYGEALRIRLKAGRAIPAEQYLRGQRVRRLIGAEVDGALQSVDLIAGPSTAVAATLLAEGFAPMRDRALDVGRHWFNVHRLPSLLGLPAVSLPGGFTSLGLPVGLQLFGRRLDEATVLQAAHAFESQTPWKRRPPIEAGEERILLSAPPVPPAPHPSEVAASIQQAADRLRELGVDALAVEPATTYRPQDES